MKALRAGKQQIPLPSSLTTKNIRRDKEINGSLVICHFDSLVQINASKVNEVWETEV